MADRPTLTIIGPGRVGAALGRLAWRVGYRIVAVAGGSDPEHTRQVAASMGDAPLLSLAAAAAAADLVLLTVRDSAIAPVCEQMVAAGGLGKAPMVVHCSGALDCSVLQPARDVGCPVGSMHPLQTFPTADAAIARLPGTYWFIEGQATVAAALNELVRAIGGKPVTIEPEQKPLYHAAAVFSSNYLTTLLDAAIRLFETIGMDRAAARKAISPLVRATVENVLEKGTADALTGPIARGDAETVRRHLDAVEPLLPDIARLYRAIGTNTVELARRSETLDEPTAEAIRNILTNREPGNGK